MTRQEKDNRADKVEWNFGTQSFGTIRKFQRFERLFVPKADAKTEYKNQENRVKTIMLNQAPAVHFFSVASLCFGCPETLKNPVGLTSKLERI